MVWAAFWWANARRAFGECVRLTTGSSHEAAETRRRSVWDMIHMMNMISAGLGVVLGLRWVRMVGADGAQGDRGRYPLGGFWCLMTAGPIERNFIPHSTTLARGWMSGNRWRVGVG